MSVRNGAACGLATTVLICSVSWLAGMPTVPVAALATAVASCPRISGSANTSRATSWLVEGSKATRSQPPSAGSEGEQDGGDEEQQPGQSAAHPWSLAKFADVAASAIGGAGYLTHHERGRPGSEPSVAGEDGVARRPPALPVVRRTRRLLRRVVRQARSLPHVRARLAARLRGVRARRHGGQHHHRVRRADRRPRRRHRRHDARHPRRAPRRRPGRRRRSSCRSPSTR